MGNIITVLVVDDSTFARRMMKNFLVEVADRFKIKLVIIEGKNGVEAVNLYDVHKPHLVFMDIVMPKKTGLEALKEIKEKHEDAKVVICSSMGQAAYINEAIRLGSLDFIVKPYNDKLGIIAEVLKKYLMY
jgi:two-component system chemotaxis response regulator CheY